MAMAARLKCHGSAALPMHRLGNSVVAGRQISCREQRRQQVQALPHDDGDLRPSPPHAGGKHVHRELPDSFPPSKMSCEPTGPEGWPERGTALYDFANFTIRPRRGGQKTSASRAKLDQATRSPRSTRSPAGIGKTMRRASRPAICLKTMDPGISPQGQTFCSFNSAEAAPMAFQTCPCGIRRR